MLKILLILLSFTVLSCSKDMEDDSPIDAAQDVTAENKTDATAENTEDAKQEDTFSVCNKSQVVQKAILRSLQKDKSEEKEILCAEVTKEDLLTITNLEVVKDDLQQTTQVSLKQGDFDGLSNLITINLSDNNLKTLPEDIINNLNKLEHVVLSGNQLEALPKNLLNGLINLHSVDFNNNKLQTLPEGIFKTSQKMEQIDLSKNNLTSIPEGTFSVEALPMLQKLSLQQNGFSDDYKENLEERILKDRKKLLAPFYKFWESDKFTLQLSEENDKK